MAGFSAGMTEKQKMADYLFDGTNLGDDLLETLETYAPKCPEADEVSFVTTKFFLDKIKEAENGFPRMLFKLRVNTLDCELEKDDEVAGSLGFRARMCLQNNEHAFRYYALALLMAEPNGPRVGQIYCGRAQLFNAIKDYKSCLKDVEKGLGHDVSPLTRKVLLVIKKDMMAVFNKTPTLSYSMLGVLQENATREKYCNEVLFRVRMPANPEIPVAAECLEIKYHCHKERYVVTTKDLAAGTTIIAEDPYVKIFADSQSWNTNHCAGCLKVTHCLDPCPGCVFAMYCSEECRLRDLDQGHKYECGCMAVLHGLNLEPCQHLAFRAICKAGPTKIHALYIAHTARIPEPGARYGRRKGFNPATGRYDSDSYYQVARLATHVVKKDLPKMTMFAICMAQVLQIKTDFNSIETELNEKREFTRFIASKILWLLFSFPINTFAIGESIKMKKPTTSAEIYQAQTGEVLKAELATAIYPVIGLICHSCCPNAMVQTTANGKMSIVVLRDVKADEEITISYGYSYWLQSSENRRDHLLDDYHFFCDCMACARKWTHLNFMWPIKMLCQKCRAGIGYNQFSALSNCVFEENSVEEGQMNCINCDEQKSLATLKNEIEKVDRELGQASDFTKSERPIDSIPIILKCISFYQNTYCPPCTKIITGFKELEKAFAKVKQPVMEGFQI